MCIPITTHCSLLKVVTDFDRSIYRHATKVAFGPFDVQFDLPDILQYDILKWKKHENGSQLIFSCQHTAPSYHEKAASHERKTIML